MSCKDARLIALRWRKWKFRLSMFIGALGLVAVCLGARYVWGPGSASAQAPGRPNPQSPSVNQPPVSTSHPPGNAAKITIMAVVNGEQIHRQQLAQECLRRYGKEVLESIVNKHLILEACHKRSIVISQQDIDTEIRRLASKFGLSSDRWLQMLQQERDINPEQYGRDIVWPTLALRHLAVDQTQVTDQEVDKLLESEVGPRVQVRIIVVSSNQKAERIRSQAVTRPEQFPKLAKDNSEDTTSASVGGLILPIRRHVGDPTVERIAFSLNEGEVSQVIHVANQYLILKCEKHLPPTVLAPQQQQAVRMRIIEHLRETKLREVASGLFKQLQDRARLQNVYNHPELQQQLPGVAATINGTPVTMLQLAEECISRHGQEVLDGEVNRLLLAQALRRQRLDVTQQDIDHEIARAADAYGFVNPKDGSPDIRGWLDHVIQEDGATEELYIHDAVWPSVALKKMVGGKIEVTEEDLTKGFEANYGPRVEVLAIVMTNHRQANEVWNMARGNPTEQFFGKLASEYSVEPISQANYGKVPPIQRHGGRPTLEKAAFELQPGEISGLISIGDKWVILFCQGRTKQVIEQLDEEIRRELAKDIHEKKLRLAMAEYFDQLKEDAQIDNFLAGTSQSGNRSNKVLADDSIRSRVPFTSNASTTSATRPGSAAMRR